MILVADASALIALSACDSLHLLDELFGNVIVPPEAVFMEVAGANKPQSSRLLSYLQGKVRTVDIVGLLTDSPNPRKYWSVLNTRLKKEGSESIFQIRYEPERG